MLCALQIRRIGFTIVGDSVSQYFEKPRVDSQELDNAMTKGSVPKGKPEVARALRFRAQGKG